MNCPADDAQDGEKPAPGNARTGQRTNIFVVATLYSPVGSTPVRIRNVSQTGALVEGGELPPKDEAVRLSRGSLSVSGNVAWCDGGKAGLKFGSRIAVADWLPHGKRVAQQLRVDEIVYNAKRISSLDVGSTHTGRTEHLLATATSTLELVSRLLELKKCLNSAAEELAGDPGVAARFQTELQMLDLTAQKLGSLADSLG